VGERADLAAERLQLKRCIPERIKRTVEPLADSVSIGIEALLRKACLATPCDDQRHDEDAEGVHAEHTRILFSRTCAALAWSAVEVAARALKRYRSVSGWCDLHGRLDDKGEVKQAARYEVTAENQLHRALDSLGMSPMARSKPGLNIARTAGAFDLARHWQEQGGDDD
jgi:hypothetical protein